MRHKEYGFYRVGFSKFTITPNSDDRAYAIIDTNVIYRLVREERINATGDFRARYYKFYSNGRIAEFYDRNVDLKKHGVLEAKKGYMGYYNYNGEDFIVQFYNSNANASELYSQILSIERDSLVLTKRNIELDAQVKSFYAKESIPKKIRITKPDW
ncbi:hypothetical protein [Flavobacterium sp. CLA17]|uniref:hypothetical protein n=1 Tax=Flavobacterium sp. CLA17 TaxID=2724135 RepID=UPI001492C12C|nr:hypothetical protein [Flavobacterium sp. CLA17]QSB26511.1 hypothetical protein HAV12_019425 [Flavobacterium sp. CLA17]